MPVLTLTDHGEDVVIGVRGEFDVEAATRLEMLVGEYVARGGAVDDLVLDLRSTTRCRTVALRRLESLIGAGMRLQADRRPRRRRRVPTGTRASCGA